MNSSSVNVLGQNIYNTITNLFLGSITFILCIYASNVSGVGSESFRQHIILNVLGYVLIIPQAVMTFSESNGWSRTMSHKNKRNVHLVLQIIGSALIIAGSIIRMQALAGFNFGTVHGIFGLLAFVMTILSLVGGIATYFTDSTKRQSKFVKIGHASFGCLTLIFSFTALCLGMDKNIFKLWISQTGAILMIVVAIFALIGVIAGAGDGIFKRIRTL